MRIRRLHLHAFYLDGALVTPVALGSVLGALLGFLVAFLM